MFASGPSNQLSLEDLANDFSEQHGVTISKQGLHDRFNDFSVEFMRALLQEQLSRQLCCAQHADVFRYFNRVRIKDSTRYGVPEQYAAVYKGQGGFTKTAAQISIQYEYNLLDGKTIDLALTSGCRNDQQDSKETLSNIEKGDLLIRDLAYTGKDYLQYVHTKGAYYLNRLNPNFIVLDRQGKTVDFSKTLKKLKRYSLPIMELEILIPKDHQMLPSRLIISKVDHKTYDKRIAKAKKERQSNGHQVTENFKTRAHLNLFITNVPLEWLSTEQVRATYSLRWQIELIFKVWKSQGHLSKVKAMKIQRFQCQLIAKLLWLLLHWQALRVVQQNLNTKCSVWKFYKVAFRLSGLLRKAIMKKRSINAWLELILKKADMKYYIETKPKKTPISMAYKNFLA